MQDRVVVFENDKLERVFHGRMAVSAKRRERKLTVIDASWL